MPELSSHFDNSMIVIEKWVPKKPITVIHYDGEKEKYFLKRFLIENENKEECVISDHNQSFMELVSTDWKPMLQIIFAKERGKDRREDLEINAEDFISIKGIKASGNQLTPYKVNQVNALEPLPYEPPEVKPAIEIEVVDEEEVLGQSSSENDDQQKLF